MQPTFQPVGNSVPEELERKLDAGGWQGPSVMLFRRLFPWRWLSSLSWRRRERRRTFCYVLFTVRSRAADWSARCTRHSLIYRTHTHTHRTPLHTAPWGWREALQTLSQGTFEAVRRRGCTGGTEDPVPELKGQPHEILDFSALWKTKQFILWWTYYIPYYTLIMYRFLSGNKCTFI